MAWEMKAVLDHVLVWGTRNLMLLTRRYRVIHTAGICSILTAIGTSVQVKEAAHSSRHIVSAYPPPHPLVIRVVHSNVYVSPIKLRAALERGRENRQYTILVTAATSPFVSLRSRSLLNLSQHAASDYEDPQD